MPLNEPSDGTAGHRDPAVAAAIARLSAEFAGHVRTTVIHSVVVGSRHDLSGAPAPALPELVERLARQRLIQSTVTEAGA